VLGILKSMLRFKDLPGRFTELRKAIVLMITSYCHERIEIKFRKWKSYIGWSPSETRQEFLSSGDAGTTFNSLSSNV
jgi:hypothetical protein